MNRIHTLHYWLEGLLHWQRDLQTDYIVSLQDYKDSLNSSFKVTEDWEVL